jgi:hypothetical protein
VGALLGAKQTDDADDVDAVQGAHPPLAVMMHIARTDTLVLHYQSLTNRRITRRGMTTTCASPVPVLLTKVQDTVTRAVQAARKSNATQRAVGAAVTGVAAAVALRWQVVLNAALSPALLVASLSWVLAHDTRQDLEEDVRLLLFPSRARRHEDTFADAAGYEADCEEDDTCLDIEQVTVEHGDEIVRTYRAEDIEIWTSSDDTLVDTHRNRNAGSKRKGSRKTMR